MTSTAHARHSPSGMEREMACPGSLKMQEGMPDTPNEHSDKGTACHHVAARCLAEGLKSASFIQQEIPVHDQFDPDAEPRFVVLDDDLAELTLTYVANIRALANGHPLYVEQRVEFTDFIKDGEHDEIEPQFGTADAVIIKGTELQVHDAKFGFRPVSVEDNKQLKVYALACLLKFEMAYDITHVRLFIHQPRLYPEPSEWGCTVEELLAFAKELKAAVQLAEEANAAHGTIPIAEWHALYLNPKPNANDCAYCKAMATCPAYAVAVASTVSTESDFPSGDSEVTAPTAFTPAPDLARLMSRVDDVEAWCLAVRAEIERRLLAELNSPETIGAFGYKLVQGRQGPRKWVEPADTEEYLRKTARLRIDQVFNLKIKSPTQVEDQLAKAPKGETPLITPFQWGKLQDNITRSEAKLSVAKATDKRPPADIRPPSPGDFPLDTLEDIKQTEGTRVG